MRDKRVILVAGLAFGDEGKGATVDWLARHTGGRLVVRYNGGAQAGHRVVTDDGRAHVFAQLGSHSFLPDARTFLSRFMLVDPLDLVTEARALARLTGDQVTVEADRKCLMVTPWHKAANRLREHGRGDARHGSCGKGIGEAVRISIEQPDLAPRLGQRGLYHRCQALRQHLLAEVEPWLSLSEVEAGPLVDPDSVSLFLRLLRDFYALCGLRFTTPAAYRDEGPVIFEGAQGVLLDQDHGLGAPDHATWSKCSFENAEGLLNELGIPEAEVYRLGVIRTHLTRHGAGPFPTEDPELAHTLSHEHNSDGPWQGPLRVGWQSAELMHQSASIIGPLDGIALTHWDWPEAAPTGVRDMLERVFEAPVVVRSFGPRASDRATQNGEG